MLHPREWSSSPRSLHSDRALLKKSSRSLVGHESYVARGLHIGIVRPFLRYTHTLHYIYPGHDSGAGRAPVACYLMRVGDSSANIIGEPLPKEAVVVPSKVNGLPNHEEKHTHWAELSGREKAEFFAKLTIRLLAVFLIIFIYICALGTMSTAFTLLSSRGLGRKISNSWIIKDPASALIVGMLITVVLQSSTTFMNVLVSMVAANMITVHMAIPMMIGSELGTSFVNGLISLTYAGDRESFKRAFSAAIIGDVFNVCCIIVVLPLELITGFIENVSWWIVDPLISEQGMQFKTLELLTDPINRLILEVDEAGLRNATIADHLYPSDYSFIMKCSFPNGTRIYDCPYSHPFIHTSLSDDTVAKIVIVSSIVVLIACLFTIVFLINTIMSGRVKTYVQRMMAKECPGKWKPATGYLIMGVGLALTLLVQSNSVFSSSLTPLAGTGVISLKKLYALTLGSNMGTTFSGVLAAMAADPTRFEKALHMAMCQVMYNVIGTLLFYPVMAMRMIPLKMAQRIGETTSKYRWFVLLYLSVLFVLIPFTVITLSLFPPAVTIICFALLYMAIGAIVVINILQSVRPELLPASLQTWNFLPVWMYSLEPYDKIITTYATRIPVLKKLMTKGKESTTGHTNGAPKTDVGLLIRLSTQTQV